MNKIIRLRRLNTPQELLQSIKMILDHLEKQGYMYIKRQENVPACRLIARFTLDYRPKILVTPGDRKFVKTIISLDPEYTIERVSDYDFRLIRR